MWPIIKLWNAYKPTKPCKCSASSGKRATETNFRARTLPGRKQKTLASGEMSVPSCRVGSQKWLTTKPSTRDAEGCSWEASQLFSQINKAEGPTSCVLMAITTWPPRTESAGTCPAFASQLHGPLGHRMSLPTGSTACCQHGPAFFTVKPVSVTYILPGSNHAAGLGRAGWLLRWEISVKVVWQGWGRGITRFVLDLLGKLWDEEVKRRDVGILGTEGESLRWTRRGKLG